MIELVCHTLLHPSSGFLESQYSLLGGKSPSSSWYFQSCRISCFRSLLRTLMSKSAQSGFAIIKLEQSISATGIPNEFLVCVFFPTSNPQAIAPIPTNKSTSATS